MEQAKHWSDAEAHRNLKNLIGNGYTDLRFGHKPHADLCKKLLNQKNIDAQVEEIHGHAVTCDTSPNYMLVKHWHVHPTSTSGLAAFGIHHRY